MSIIARRQTADDKTVILWDDGQVTGVLGTHFMNEAKSGSVLAPKVLDLGWLILDAATLVNYDEMVKLVRAAQSFRRKGSVPTPGEFRAKAFS